MSWIRVDVSGKTLRVAIVRSGNDVLVGWGGRVHRVSPDSAAAVIPRAKERELRAPMTGRIVQVAAVEGAAVQAGQTLVVLEAMKMEYQVAAPREGVVETVTCTAGERVDLGRVLVTLAP